MIGVFIDQGQKTGVFPEGFPGKRGKAWQRTAALRGARPSRGVGFGVPPKHRSKQAPPANGGHLGSTPAGQTS